MTVISEENVRRIRAVWPKFNLADYPSVEKIKEKCSQIVIDGEGAILLTSIKNLYYVKKHDDTVQEWTKKDVTSARASAGLPDGHIIIIFSDGDVLDVTHIHNGRCYDFAQDVKPRSLTLAGYDNTIRTQNPRLLNPDHAEEIDRLRKWMQEGHISQYEFDDANPCYPKAGK